MDPTVIGLISGLTTIVAGGIGWLVKKLIAGAARIYNDREADRKEYERQLKNYNDLARESIDATGRSLEALARLVEALPDVLERILEDRIQPRSNSTSRAARGAVTRDAGRGSSADRNS